jgi:hypothetical protein
MNSIRPGINHTRAAADAEAAAEAADVLSSIAGMLDKVKDFAERALKAELDGGPYQDEAGAVVDAISDAIGRAQQAESDLSRD